MPQLQPLLIVPLLLTIMGCQKETDTQQTDSDDSALDSQNETNSDAEWEELDEDGSSVDGSSGEEEEWDDKEEEEYDTGKDSETCADEVAEGVACEGGWEDTLCFDQYGEMWWCEDGYWTSDKR